MSVQAIAKSSETSVVVDKTKSHQGLRRWQEELLLVFEQAVLPATKRIYGIVSSCERDEDIDRQLETYYRSVNRPKIHENEIVWEDERKIETLLLTKVSHGRFLRAQFQAATGAGKSLVVTELIRAHLKSDVRAVQNRRPVYLVVEPSLNLVRQGYEALLKGLGQNEVECICVASKSPAQKTKGEAVDMVKGNPKKPVVIFTTKNSSAGQRSKKEERDIEGLMSLFVRHEIVVDLLLIDESHTVAGDAEGKRQKKTYSENCSACMLKISFTATPVAAPQEVSNGYRQTMGGAGTNQFFYCQNDCLGMFGPTMYRYSYGEALKDGVVVPLHLLLMDNSLSSGDAGDDTYLSKMVRAWDQRKDFDDPTKSSVDVLDASSEKQRPAGIEEKVWRLQRLLMFLQILHDIATGHQTHVLVFCSSIDRVQAFCDIFKFLCKRCLEKRQLGATSILPSSPEAKRLELVSQNIYWDVSRGKSPNNAEGFKACKMGILANVNKISVGFDIPQITGVFFPDVKGMTNPNLLIQCIGRGTRVHPGKTRCAVYLPCLVPGVNISLQDKGANKDSLSRLRAKERKKTWEGSFSIMALTIYDYLEQNNLSEDRPLVIECIRSRQILSKEKVEGPEASTSGSVMQRPSEASRQFRPKINDTSLY